jgi:hypothetical protein
MERKEVRELACGKIPHWSRGIRQVRAQPAGMKFPEPGAALNRMTRFITANQAINANTMYQG